VKIALAVHTPWTLAADTEAVAEAVQLPHPPTSAAVQRAHQVPGDWVVAHPQRREPVGGVQGTQRLAITRTISLRPSASEVEAHIGLSLLTGEHREVDRGSDEPLCKPAVSSSMPRASAVLVSSGVGPGNAETSPRASVQTEVARQRAPSPISPPLRFIAISPAKSGRSVRRAAS
jgi:hypothetical protein